MKSNTMKQKRTKASTKIFMYTFAILTLLSIVGVVFGVMSIESPNTAIPEIILILSLSWLGFIIYLGN